jgi:hypothetical protein
MLIYIDITNTDLPEVERLRFSGMCVLLAFLRTVPLWHNKLSMYCAGPFLDQ